METISENKYLFTLYHVGNTANQAVYNCLFRCNICIVNLLLCIVVVLVLVVSTTVYIKMQRCSISCYTWHS